MSSSREWGGYPLSDSLHRNQTLYRLADTLRYVYGRRPPQAPALSVGRVGTLTRSRLRQCSGMSPEVARKLRAVALRRVLMWKFEDGPEDAPDEGDPNDVGPAWLDTYEGDERVSPGRWPTASGSLGPRRSTLPLPTVTNWR